MMMMILLLFLQKQNVETMVDSRRGLGTRRVSLNRDLKINNLNRDQHRDTSHWTLPGGALSMTVTGDSEVHVRLQIIAI